MDVVDVVAVLGGTLADAAAVTPAVTEAVYRDNGINLDAPPPPTAPEPENVGPPVVEEEEEDGLEPFSAAVAVESVLSRRKSTARWTESNSTPAYALVEPISGSSEIKAIFSEWSPSSLSKRKKWRR